MDLNRAMADHEVEVAMKRSEERNLRVLLVCPANSELPNDGFLVYAAATDVKALLAAEDGSVLVFAESDNRVLRMLIEYQDQFQCVVKVLEGVPNVDYAPWFNSVTWSQDKISYSGLLSEMSIASSMHDAKKDDLSVYDRERSQYERANGSVKLQDNFRVAGSEDDEEGETFDGSR